MAQQVDRDPVQPCARLTSLRVIRGAAVIGLQEGLRGELVCDPAVHAPAQVGGDRVVVAIE
jgi:hypothetical protein